MKRISKILILAILCTVCLVLLACGKIDSIHFETEPRKTYVQGQEFTLEDAVIVATSKDKTTPVDMAEVSISGYNKDQLGSQTVTITYGEQTLTHTVTVIPRIALEGITRDYFIGDSFDKTKGRLRVADDNGNTKSVNMSEEAVIVEGFDSSSAGPKTITVKYGNYTGTANVTVYSAETIELTSKPKKTTYYSHDTEFVITGAFFTVTANNGSLTRMIEVTPDMVTGFQEAIKSATMEHMDTPLRQTVKFNYLGKSFDFNITVRFSGVSLALLRSEELKDVTPETATQEQNEIALDALLVYADLTPTEQKLVSDEAIQKLLEIGIAYGAKVFADEAETYSETIRLGFTKDSETKRLQGKINIIATSYDAVVRDLERLEDPFETLLSLGATLYELKEEFYFKKIGDKTVDEILCNVFEPSAIEDVLTAFEMLIELHEILVVVPDDWTRASLADYENDIRAAVATMNASDYQAFEGSATIYSILSSWRAKDDYFDIIYAYYYQYDRENLVNTLWEKIYLPKPLQELFTIHNLACQEAMNMRVGDDTSTFMYYYFRANEIANTIKASGITLHTDLYNFFNFDRLISAYLFFGTAKIKDYEINGIAYVYHASSLLENGTYDKLLNNFFELFKLSLQDGFSFEDEKVMELARKMLNNYLEFTPSERFAFLSSLHCDYRITQSTELVLHHTVGEDGILTCFNYFTDLLYSGYREVLSEEAYSVFTRLMEATELYALRYHNPTLYNGFTDANGVEHLGFVAFMEAILADAAKLEESEKALFTELLEKMTKEYNNTKTPVTPEINDNTAALFEDLKAAIEIFYLFYNQAVSEDVEFADKFNYYVIAFSAYERAKTIAEQILSGANSDVLYAFGYQEVTFNIAVEDAIGVVNATYDYMLDGIGGIFYLTLIRTDIESYNLATIYLTYNVSSFLDHAYDVFVAEVKGEINASYKDQLHALMVEYSKLSNDQIFVLQTIGASKYLFDAIDHCYANSGDDKTASVVTLFTEAARAYAVYSLDTKDTANKTAFVNAFAALKDAYTALEDKTAFDAVLQEAYAFFAAKYALLSLNIFG